MLIWITSKLLSKCTTYQNNVYGSDGCLVWWDTSHYDHPVIAHFMRHTRLGKWLEHRWVKRAHRRIGVKVSE